VFSFGHSAKNFFAECRKKNPWQKKTLGKKASLPSVKKTLGKDLLY